MLMVMSIRYTFQGNNLKFIASILLKKFQLSFLEVLNFLSLLSGKKYYILIVGDFNIPVEKMLRRFFKGSSSQSSKEKQDKEKEKPKYNLPRLAEVRSCEWPCEDFLKEAGIHEDFYALIETAGLTGFMND